MNPDVAAIVVTYNSASVVADLLDSLPAALDGLEADVVVVDNASSDGTADLVEGRGDCRVLRAENGGYAAGVNLGVRAAPGARAYLVLNPDVRLSVGAVRRLYEVMVEGSAVTVPRVLNADGTLHRSLRNEPTLARALGLSRTGLHLFSEYVRDEERYRRPHDVDWALGAVLMMSRECYAAVGGWDESFFLYSEETDFLLRARDRGMLTRYVPSAEATHIGGASGRSGATHAMQIVNRVRLYRRRHNRAAAALYYALTVASELTWALRGNAHSRTSLLALVRPARRPPVLGCSRRLMPT